MPFMTGGREQAVGETKANSGVSDNKIPRPKISDPPLRPKSASNTLIASDTVIPPTNSPLAIKSSNSPQICISTSAICAGNPKDNLPNPSKSKLLSKPSNVGSAKSSNPSSKPSSKPTNPTWNSYVSKPILEAYGVINGVLNAELSNSEAESVSIPDNSKDIPIPDSSEDLFEYKSNTKLRDKVRATLLKTNEDSIVYVDALNPRIGLGSGVKNVDSIPGVNDNRDAPVSVGDPLNPGVPSGNPGVERIVSGSSDALISTTSDEKSENEIHLDDHLSDQDFLNVDQHLTDESIAQHQLANKIAKYSHLDCERRTSFQKYNKYLLPSVDYKSDKYSVNKSLQINRSSQQEVRPSRHGKLDPQIILGKSKVLREHTNESTVEELLSRDNSFISRENSAIRTPPSSTYSPTKFANPTLANLVYIGNSVLTIKPNNSSGSLKSNQRQNQEQQQSISSLVRIGENGEIHRIRTPQIVRTNEVDSKGELESRLEVRSDDSNPSTFFEELPDNISIHKIGSGSGGSGVNDNFIPDNYSLVESFCSIRPDERLGYYERFSGMDDEMKSSDIEHDDRNRGGEKMTVENKRVELGTNINFGKPVEQYPGQYKSGGATSSSSGGFRSCADATEFTPHVKSSITSGFTPQSAIRSSYPISEIPDEEPWTDGGLEPVWGESTKHTGGPNVWLHVYDIDPLTQWLNENYLAQAQSGAYHVGIEVYGDEWSFLYYNDVLDPTVTGCNRVLPRRHPDFTFKTSIYMGRTPLNGTEVSKIMFKLMPRWPTLSYHITDRNCVDFADTLCRELRVPRPFPDWVRGGLKVARDNPLVKGTVDAIWNLVKWWNKVDEENAYQVGNDDVYDEIINDPEYQRVLEENTRRNREQNERERAQNGAVLPNDEPSIPRNDTSNAEQSSSVSHAKEGYGASHEPGESSSYSAAGKQRLSVQASNANAPATSWIEKGEADLAGRKDAIGGASSIPTKLSTDADRGCHNRDLRKLYRKI